MTTQKIIGSALIVAGTAIGGGMLAMPIASFGIGFSKSIILLISMYLLSTYTALVTLEVNATFNTTLSVPRITKEYCSKTLGIFATFILVILFYSLLAAYISGISEITKAAIEVHYSVTISETYLKFAFAFVIGLLVSSYTKVIDLSNRLFFIVKIIAFVLMIGIFLPQIDINNLGANGKNIGLLVTVPIFFTAFGFHGSIAAILKYLNGKEKSAHYAFIIGGLIALTIYLLWQIITFGVLPPEGEISFTSIEQSNNTLGAFIESLATIAKTPSLKYITSLFSWVAIITSLLGVGIGLFDFFIEKNVTKSIFIKKIRAGLLTFVPPFLISSIGKEFFVKALSFAAISLSILAVLLPTGIALKLRVSKQFTRYKAPGGIFLLIIAFVLGIAVIITEIINLFL